MGEIDADPAVTYYRGIQPLTSQESEAALRRLVKIRPGHEKKSLTWCVRRQADDAFIGLTLVRCMKRDWREWEVGYCMAQTQWGKGYATEATHATLEFAFQQLGAHRIIANVFPDNGPSRRLLDKLGFRQEAYQVENYYEHGAWQDNVQYALLDREFGEQG